MKTPNSLVTRALRLYLDGHSVRGVARMLRIGKSVVGRIVKGAAVSRRRDDAARLMWSETCYLDGLAQRYMDARAHVA